MMRLLVVALFSLVLTPALLRAQAPTIGDMTTVEGVVPKRLMGYGLVVGLEGTGDRSMGNGVGAGYTVRSIVNLLERYGVRVPEDRLRFRNVAAVLVTAEVSPFARPGSRFDVEVSSIGDATSIEGGVLYMTPLALSPNSPPVASSQGRLVVSQEGDQRRAFTRHGSATVVGGGAVEVPLGPRPDRSELRLLLKDPSITNAARIRDAIDAALGAGSAQIEDPGSVLIATMPGGEDPMSVLAQVAELPVDATTSRKLVVDARTGAVVAGGTITLGPASVSHGAITLTIGNTDPGEEPVDGRTHVDDGASVQDVAGALHTAGARPAEIAEILMSLQKVGALRAEVEIR